MKIIFRFKPPFGYLALFITTLFLAFGPIETYSGENALRQYLKKSDNFFNWKETEVRKTGKITVYHLEMVSQLWRQQFWSHHIVIIRPDELKHRDKFLLLITGDGTGMNYIEKFKPVAEHLGMCVGILTQVPNQPLYDGRKEDALIAYTFDQYLKTGDKTWPLLFPMVKSAVKAMDTIQDFSRKRFGDRISGFIVTGASKRGWTTWLTGATDTRVIAIAPMVIDMLNMKAQTKWAKKIYGRQSEEITDYTDLNLIEKMDDPRMVELRNWVDPYSYLHDYKIPILLQLGTNDPYWTVDSIRHYWNEIPEPKLIYQTPNAGHDLGDGKEALNTLTMWAEIIVNKKPLPLVKWEFEYQTNAMSVKVVSSYMVESCRLWQAYSDDRDFRNDKWFAQDLNKTFSIPPCRLETQINAKAFKYTAAMIELDLKSPVSGRIFKLSTGARVIPDTEP